MNEVIKATDWTQLAILSAVVILIGLGYLFGNNRQRFLLVVAPSCSIGYTFSHSLWGAIGAGIVASFMAPRNAHPFED